MQSSMNGKRGGARQRTRRGHRSPTTGPSKVRQWHPLPTLDRGPGLGGVARGHTCCVAARDRMPARVLLGRLAICCCFVFVPAGGGCDDGTPDRSSSDAPGPSTNEGATPDQIARHATAVRVDAATGDVMAVVPVGPDPLLLGVASGRIWTLNLGDGTLSLVDPLSNEARTVRRGEVVGIASDTRDLWLAREGNVVSRLDGKTGREEVAFELGSKPLFALRDAGFLGVGPASVWLTVPPTRRPRWAARAVAPRRRDRRCAREAPARKRRPPSARRCPLRMDHRNG